MKFRKQRMPGKDQKQPRHGAWVGVHPVDSAFEHRRNRRFAYVCADGGPFTLNIRMAQKPRKVPESNVCFNVCINAALYTRTPRILYPSVLASPPVHEERPCEPYRACGHCPVAVDYG